LALGKDAERELTAYSWEGNIRELDNVMQRAAILAAGAEVSAADLMLNVGPFAKIVTAPEPVLEAPLETDMRSVEKRHILEALEASGGVKKLAAERLGISERTLRYKLQRYREEDGESV
jgi:two-component system response regulator FlrC